MLNLRLLYNFITLLLLVALQVLIFDRMTLFNYATPYIYILFILFYRTDQNRYIFLLLCFLLGWGVDIFEDTGGINAFASLTIGFLSKPIIRLVSGTKFFEFEEFRFSDFNVGQWFIYLVLMVFIHHFLLFFFESLSLDQITEILRRTVYSTTFTLIFVFFYLIMFRKRIGQ